MSFRSISGFKGGVFAIVVAACLITGRVLAEEPAPPAQVETGIADEIPPAAKAPNASDHSASVATPEVALARFTTAIENREPVDAVAFLGSESSEIFFYTDLRGLAGETVTHRWEYDGEVIAEVPFAVGSDKFRVWSSKQLRPERTGEWTVTVVKGDGEVIAAESFTYNE